MIDALAFILPILIAAGIISCWRSHIGSIIWWATFIAFPIVVTFNLMLWAFPFWGLASEISLGIAAGFALTPTMLMFLSLKEERTPNATSLWRACAFLPLMIGVMMPLTGRVSYAQRIAWHCDGVIISKFNSSNHNVPAMIVAVDGHHVTLEGVDDALWQQSVTGQRLVKTSGSAYGLLDGRKVRIVPRTFPSWHEPGV